MVDVVPTAVRHPQCRSVPAPSPHVLRMQSQASGVHTPHTSKRVVSPPSPVALGGPAPQRSAPTITAHPAGPAHTKLPTETSPRIQTRTTWDERKTDCAVLKEGLTGCCQAINVLSGNMGTVKNEVQQLGEKLQEWSCVSSQELVRTAARQAQIQECLKELEARVETNEKKMQVSLEVQTDELGRMDTRLAHVEVTMEKLDKGLGDVKSWAETKLSTLHTDQVTMKNFDKALSDFTFGAETELSTLRTELSTLRADQVAVKERLMVLAADSSLAEQKAEREAFIGLSRQYDDAQKEIARLRLMLTPCNRLA